LTIFQDAYNRLKDELANTKAQYEEFVRQQDEDHEDEMLQVQHHHKKALEEEQEAVLNLKSQASMMRRRFDGFKAEKEGLQSELKGKENELKMEEMARELAGYRALNAGQLGDHKNRPLPQHAQVPTAGWRPPGAAIAPPLASAAAPRGPSAAGPSTLFPPAAAKSKKSDPLAKLKKK
jgi:hypothetical protein